MILLHIVHVIIGLNNGGAEHFLYRLVQSQINAGKAVTVVSLSGLGSLGHRFLDLGVSVNCLDLHSVSSFWKVVKQLRQIFKTSQPSVVQSWMYHADFLSSIALCGLKTKHIWSVRCTDIPKGSRLTYVLMKFCAVMSYLCPDKICYVANAAMLRHHQHGYDKNKSIAISNGYDFVDFKLQQQARQEIRAKLDISPDCIFFGVLGRFHQDKGQDLLLEAFARVKLDNVKLALIGTGCSEDNEALIEDINRLGLAANVKLLGNQSKIIEYLSALDIYIMPSRTEGFPNALAEAMAMGLPCIATRVGDTELLCNGHAIICEPDVESIAESIKKMLSLAEIEKKMLGESAAAYVRASFSIASIEKQYSKLYSNIVGSE